MFADTRVREHHTGREYSALRVIFAISVQSVISGGRPQSLGCHTTAV